jgi:hypothetical protein
VEALRVRPFAARAAVTVACLLAALVGAVPAAHAARQSYRPVAERHGVFFFKLRHVKLGRVVGARLYVDRASRRLSVNRLRRSARKGVLRASAPRPTLRIWARQRAQGGVVEARHRVKLVLSTSSTSTTTSTSSSTTSTTSSGSTTTTGTSSSIGSSISPAGTSCNGPFKAGNWPSACWRPYADTSPWNQQIPAGAPSAASSSAIVSRVLGFGAIQNIVANPSKGNDWMHPTYYPEPSDPVFTIHCTESWGTCSIEGMQVRIPDAAKAADAGDAHMTVVDQASGWEYDFWGVQSKPAGGGTISIKWGGRVRIDGDGLGDGGTAAQFGSLAGIIRAPELEAGQINHALFMTIKCDNGSYVYPATKTGQSCSSIGLSGAGAPPMGTRLQLAMSDDQIAALPVPPWKKTILLAMAHYGMYFGDTGGGSWSVEAESGMTYTSFGLEDRLVTFAKANDVPSYNGSYVFGMADGVDWARYLRVVDPCVARGTC